MKTPYYKLYHRLLDVINKHGWNDKSRMMHDKWWAWLNRQP